MGGAFDELPTDAAQLLRSILQKRDPLLAEALGSRREVAMQEREGVEDALADELMTQMSAPDWTPTSYGLRIEGVIDVFLGRFPIERG